MAALLRRTARRVTDRRRRPSGRRYLRRDRAGTGNNARRRFRHRARRLLALLVAIGTLGTGINTELVQCGQGAGQQFSLAVAALGAATFFAIRLYRAVRAR
jgi:hypothetical protein